MRNSHENHQKKLDSIINKVDQEFSDNLQNNQELCT